MKVQVEMGYELVKKVVEGDPGAMKKDELSSLVAELKEAYSTRGEVVMASFLTSKSQETAGQTRNTKAGLVTDYWGRFPKKVAESSGIPLIRSTIFRPTKGAIFALQAAAKLQSQRGVANTDLVVIETRAPLAQVLTALAEPKKTSKGTAYIEVTAREIAISAIASYRRENGQGQPAADPAPTTAEQVVNSLGF